MMYEEYGKCDIALRTRATQGRTGGDGKVGCSVVIMSRRTYVEIEFGTRDMMSLVVVRKSVKSMVV